jgi:predicted transcriptional regulator of viral defense system
MHDSERPDVRGLEADAYQQSGYFTISQAQQHSVSRQLLEHHIRQGRFERIRRGLYRIRSFPTAQHDEIREKWMAVGMDKAIASHESALALLELSDTIPDKVHLLVPRRHRGLRRPPGVVIHTRPDNEKVATVSREGMPLTTPARTLVDIVDRIQPEQAAMAIEQALRRGLLTTRQLLRVAEERGKKRAVEALLADEASR